MVEKEKQEIQESRDKSRGGGKKKLGAAGDRVWKQFTNKGPGEERQLSGYGIAMEDIEKGREGTEGFKDILLVLYIYVILGICL